MKQHRTVPQMIRDNPCIKAKVETIQTYRVNVDGIILVFNVGSNGHETLTVGGETATLNEMNKQALRLAVSTKRKVPKPNKLEDLAPTIIKEAKLKTRPRVKKKRQYTGMTEAIKQIMCSFPAGQPVPTDLMWSMLSDDEKEKFNRESLSPILWNLRQRGFVIQVKKGIGGKPGIYTPTRKLSPLK